MPSVSQKQQRWAGMELAKQRATGQNDTSMSGAQLKDFASTSRKTLPVRKLSTPKLGGRK